MSNDPIRLMKEISEFQAKKCLDHFENGRENELETDFSKFIGKNAQSLVNNKPIYRIGFHYVSPTFGKWMRLYHDPKIPNDGNPFKNPPSHIEMYVHHEIYSNIIPRNRNLLVHPGLFKPLLIQFGGNKSNNGSNTIYITSNCLRELKRLLIEGLPGDDPSERFIFSFLPADKYFSSRLQSEFPSVYKFLIGDLKKGIKYVFSKNINSLLAKVYDDNTMNRYLLDIFLFSFFPSIRVFSENQKLLIKLTPYRIDSSSNSKGQDGELCACTAIAGEDLSSTDKLGSKLHDLILDLLLLDLWVANERSSADHRLVYVEDVIRECARVEKVTFHSLNEFPRWFCNELNMHINAGCKHKLMDKACACSEDYMEKCSWYRMCYGEDRIVSVSRKYLNMLKDIERRMLDIDKAKPNVSIVYLYSEPGAGKEQIAKLCHLFSKRGNEPPSLDESAYKDIYPKFTDVIGSLPEKRIDKLEFADRAKNISIFKEEKRYFFNYIPLNSALINDNNFSQILFGTVKDPLKQIGILCQAHFWGGTVFLDEFNTIRPVDIAARFLRILEKPYEAYIEGIGTPVKLNIHIVFAGNLDRDGLLRAGFNPALVFRICENQITVPPLRERPEDIALFALYQCNKHNEKLPAIEQVHHIDPNGLRLICNLPWETNYRGLKGFMDDLLSHRKYHRISNREITYEEILDCLGKRGLLSGKTIQLKEDAYHEK